MRKANGIMVTQMEPDNIDRDVQSTTVIPVTRISGNDPNHVAPIRQAVYDPNPLNGEYMVNNAPDHHVPSERNDDKGHRSAWCRLGRLHRIGIIVVTALAICWAIGIISANNNRTVEVTEPVVVPYQQQEEEPAKPNANLDLNGIKGQYWSNAQKILDARNADTTNMLVLTDNGKTPILASNWRVESIGKQDDGSLVVHLSQIKDYTGEATDAGRSAADKAGQLWNDLVNDGKTLQ